MATKHEEAFHDIGSDRSNERINHRNQSRKNTLLSDAEIENLHPFEKLNSSFEWIRNYAKTFALNGRKIEVIKDPTEFHSKLKSLARTSKKRILLASLYLGTGSHEKELVSSLEEALSASHDEKQNLRVTVVLDYMRGSRGSTNSRTMLLPSIKKFFKTSSTLPQTTLQLFLFHTPDLKGMLKQILPERFNEVVGLFHIKAYVFDDSVIISGANLSKSYFSDRQDRYILIKNFRPLADYYDRLLTTISKFSFLVRPDDTLHYDADRHHPYLNEAGNNEFRRKLKEEIEEVIKPSIGVDSDPTDECDTILHPLVQMGSVGVDQDRLVTELTLRKLPPGSDVFLASGYFNLTEEYMQIINSQLNARFNILTAAPQANSFFQSAGVSKYIPVAYTHISRKFLKDVQDACQGDRIRIHEYSRPGWTIHAKGIWIYPSSSENQSTLPYMTLIGSPNYGYRSVKRDFESQIVLITKNESLQRQLHEEKENLYKDSERVTDATFEETGRAVPTWVAWLTPHIKNFF